MVDVIDGIHAPPDMYRANDMLPTSLPKDRAMDAGCDAGLSNAHRQWVNWSSTRDIKSQSSLLHEP